MRYDLDGTPPLAVGIPLPQVTDADAAYFEIIDLDRDRVDAAGARHLAPRRVGVHHGGRRRPRAVGEPPGAAPARRREPGRRGHRRRPPRHPPRGAPATPTSARLADVVQRHGPGPPGPHRARRPLRLRRVPRAALAADDDGGRRRRPRLAASGAAPTAASRPSTSSPRRSAGSASSSRTSSRSAATTPARCGSTSTTSGWPSSCCRPSTSPGTATCRSSSTPIWPAWSCAPTSAAWPESWPTCSTTPPSTATAPRR